MANTDKIIWTGGMWKHTFFSDDIAIDHIILDKTFGSAYGEEIDGIGWNYVYTIGDFKFINILYVKDRNDFDVSDKLFRVPDKYKATDYQFSARTSLRGWSDATVISINVNTVDCIITSGNMYQFNSGNIPMYNIALRYK